MLKLPITLLFSLISGFVFSQYISRSEPVPFDCPSVCAGGKLILKVPQVENLSQGAQVQAWLSNAQGSFSSGTTTLTPVRYSLNQGSSWINGPYSFSGNQNNLFLEIEFPETLLPGNGYTIRMRSSTGYTANDVFQCSSNNRITITPFQQAEPAVAQDAFGIDRWFGHAYSWTPSVSSILSTPSLVNQQSFFSAANYKGHLVYNPLNLDVNFANTGGIPGSASEGGSLGCDQAMRTNFSLRLKRRQFFSPGRYVLTIQGDDGIRLSIDGGQTWILDSFIEQTYSSSFKSTNTAFPNGVCLAGNVDLVIEYFQRPADARLTFRVLSLSQLNLEPIEPQTVCEGDPATFVFAQTGNQSPVQWQMSTDGGLNFSNLSNNSTFSGVNSDTLKISVATSALHQAIFRAFFTSECSNQTPSDTAILKVKTSATSPDCEAVCLINPTPNAFSPNGDGKNDLFYPVATCKLEGFSLKVFDRWGQLYYSGTDAESGWDGKTAGKAAPDGTYFYLLEYIWNGEQVKKNGYVQLLR